MKTIRLACATLITVLLLSCATGPLGRGYQAEIIRTEGGIPHIYADDWGSLGFATLYVMAEDNVCILGRQYLKFSARQSRYLGASQAHLASDYFYQLLIDRNTTAVQLDPRLEQLFAGAAAGYNHYLQTTGVDNIPDPNCRGARWLQAVSATDLKRVSGADYALDYMHAMIVAAAPPASSVQKLTDDQVARAAEIFMELPKQGGSNAIAVGKEVALGANALLVANPHMPWNEPFQRFYPMHQVIPGQLDMLGANLIGRPRVGFGTNRHLAWTSTVSTAKRASFFTLELVPGHPTQYLFDGVVREMIEETVVVDNNHHTFYSTHFGALLVQSPFFPWTETNAVAVMLPEVGFRGENSAFEQYAASSVRELKQVHNKYQFLTVNLIAADDRGEVMYTDPGPVPNISNRQFRQCSMLHGAAFDGSRSDCLWQNDRDAAAQGIIGPSRLPLIYRQDFVTNSNDSYWLANPAQPLPSHADILGSNSSKRTLRTRSGLTMVADIRQRDGGISLSTLMDMTLANENYAGQLIRDDLVQLCRKSGRTELAEACEVLVDWDLHDNLDSRGTHLLRLMLASANGPQYTRYLPAVFKPRVAFDVTDPVNTPYGLSQTGNEVVLDHLANAVAALEDVGIPLDARLGDIQHVSRKGRKIPIHGGPELAGVFNKIEAGFQGSEGYSKVSRSSSSWIMATAFTEQGPVARGILTYSLSANPNSPHYSDQTEMFSVKKWLHLPYRRADVLAAAKRSYQLAAPR